MLWDQSHRLSEIALLVKTNMKKNTIFLIVGGVVVVLVGVMIFFSMQKPKVVEKVTQEQSQDVIPTVDASTKVDAEFFNGKRELKLKVSGMPKGTESVEAEVMYKTKQNIDQGTFGQISVETGESSKMTLGTCSSGRCVYHEVDGPIQVTIKFSGEYGEKVLSKDFSL